MPLNRRLVTAALVPMMVTACVTAPAKRDALCQQLQQFAASVPNGQTRTVMLRGGWGGDSPDALMTHFCDASGYEPGKIFCAYLVEHTWWEFGKYNARRAAVCLESADQANFLASLDEQRATMELQGHLADKSTSGPTVMLRFEPSEISQLTISVSGGGN